MNKEILKNIIYNGDLEKFEDVFLSDLTKMTYAWKEVNNDLLLMFISEKTEIEIRKILCNIGEEITQICDLMIRENNKS